LGKNINSINRKTEALLDARKEVGPEVNAEKTKCMFMSHHQTAGQYNIKVVNKSLKNGTNLKYLGMMVLNQNRIHEEIKSRLNLGNAYYQTVQNLLSSHLVSKNIQMHKTKTLPVLLYECEIWSLTLKKKHRLRVSANRVLRKMFVPETNDLTGG
jgi:hypothetical protein